MESSSYLEPLHHPALTGWPADPAWSPSLPFTWEHPGGHRISDSKTTPPQKKKRVVVKL